jgi:hypothetical protein
MERRIKIGLAEHYSWLSLERKDIIMHLHFSTRIFKRLSTYFCGSDNWNTVKREKNLKRII